MNPSWIDKYWYGKHPLRWCLYPLTIGYRMITVIRRLWLQKRQAQFQIPVIVVGNITVGGVGKTPVVIALIQALTAKGLKVGVVSRGYGVKLRTPVRVVFANDSAADVGDEPLLIVQKTHAPMVLARKRADAVAHLLAHDAIDVVISDDGLQHYAMGRAIEIAVIDGTRGMGNGLCLPAGPLREPVTRLQQVDFVVINGGDHDDQCNEHRHDVHTMTLLPEHCVHLLSGETISIEQLPKPIAAVAGIGNPQRFFTLLKQQGLVFTPYPFPDHHRFVQNDFDFKEESIIMTEKDAVKCRDFAQENMYYLTVKTELGAAFWKAFWSHEQLQGII